MLPDAISTLWSDTQGLSMSCLVQEMHCTLQTRASHSTDPGVAHCRPRRRTLQTQVSHTADPGIYTADPGVAHCRPRRRTLQIQVSHTAHPSIAHCTPEHRTLHTRAQAKSPISVRNSAVHKRLRVQGCLEYKPVSMQQPKQMYKIST